MRIATVILLGLAATAALARLVPFEQDGRWGYRDSRGAVVIEPRYQAADPFSSKGIAAVLGDRGWVYIDRTGRVLIAPFIFDNGPDYFHQGLARFTAEGKFGFFNSSGAVVIGPQFDFADSFSQDRAAVCQGCRKVAAGEHWFMEGGTWGFIDRAGMLVIPLRFEAAESFTGGRARVKVGGTWRSIDRKGRLYNQEH
jgi:hypothetical protein